MTCPCIVPTGSTLSGRSSSSSAGGAARALCQRAAPGSRDAARLRAKMLPMSETGAPTVPRAASRARVEIIDYLRLLAAISVMGFHYLYNGINNGKVGSISHEPIARIAEHAHLGVNLFFMISGFVITASVRGKTARQFAVGRALRLYPAFWVAVGITTFFALVLGGERMGVTPQQVLVNLTMIPSLLGQPYVDGVYWTLLYELQFYVMVFALVLFGQGNRVAALMPAWAMLMLYVTMMSPRLADDVPYLGGYFVWFAAGAIICSIAESGWSAYRAAGLLAAYIPISDLEITTDSLLKTLVFLLMMTTLSPKVRSLRLPGSATAGGLTYPIYLLHAHIGYMLLDTFATESNKWVAYAAVVGFVLILAYALHRLVERHPASRRFWAWLLGATLGRAVDLLQSLVDRMRALEARRDAGKVPSKP
ncbi:acyltransferase [Brachybacterium ginsengisoli]|uniref:Acyltransferase n=2 Tax=Brachybacterium ginsengisoli TaxID=1331682 RepID=A0A291GX59_9MICO|nr:acyltransferase [Brachybacterium ginsengisoli]